jgi:hypothetical protein
MKLSFFRILFIALLLSSCRSTYEKTADKLAKDAMNHGFSQKTYKTKNFKIYTLQKITDINKPVRVYIEGDGKVFIRDGVISPNPTPTSFFLTNLILSKDHSANILYVARPCQYVKDKKCYGSNQPEKYWLDARFSPEVIESINEVMENFGQYELEFIGYSGGANVIKYAATYSQKKHKNVASLRSIAGNLDDMKFAEIHAANIATNSLNLDKDSLSILAKIPQIHFVGSDDKTVPAAVAQSYLKKLPNTQCARIVNISGASHSAGWYEVWDDLLQIDPFCTGSSVKVSKYGNDLVVKKIISSKSHGYKGKNRSSKKGKGKKSKR